MPTHALLKQYTLIRGMGTEKLDFKVRVWNNATLALEWQVFRCREYQEMTMHR